MARKGKITRTITTKECHWLGGNLEEGRVVYEFNRCTYGCVESGIAVSDEPDSYPFYEIPRDAVEWDNA